ncbi:hypothetical protein YASMINEVIRUS_1019 [Yasminevirus sp. GU-2018]|uniref:Uncharacterized protein n=1 Tax=Yasminevirus sp. GU-2018 TaxID=2420051 RepID=A0A5K0UBP8_9VIRU|nr:hypothetical protein YASMINEVIRUS_1019 [Yasminevirus sp. GU-2018]
MLHSQLKTKFPNCPFVVPSNDFNKLTAPTFSEDVYDNVLMMNLIKRSYSDSVTTHYSLENDSYQDRVSNFINDLTSNGNFSKILYCSVKQTAPKYNRKLTVNFHLSAYRDINTPLIDREFTSDISWTVIPLSVDAVADKTNYTINLIPRQINSSTNTNSKSASESDVARSLDPTFYVNDSECFKIEADTLKMRTGKRSFTVRDDVEVVEKRDSFALPAIQTDSRMEFRALSSQVDLTSKTRSSAQLMRERAANPFKAYRLRNNPEAFAKSLKLDPLIRGAGDKVVETNNANYNNFRVVEPKAIFDYAYESVGVRRLNGVLRCTPSDTGKMLIGEPDASNQVGNGGLNVRFLSIMCHKGVLHITLHDIDLV